MSKVSRPRRREIISALRRGTVPRAGLEYLAVGLEPFEETMNRELDDIVVNRGGGFKAVRGAYGSGKTFFSRWLRHIAQEKGFATAEVQVSETETPLYKMETIYRRSLESLATREWSDGAFRSLIDRWFLSLEEEAISRFSISSNDDDTIAKKVGGLLEERLADVSSTNPQFSAALRGCHRARVLDDPASAEGLLAWLMGQPNVSADIKRKAGIKGELDHFGAGAFIRGLLEVLRQTGRKGLLLVLDEVETVQRMRSDVREKSLNGLRQLVDELDKGQYPGLYLVVTGTPEFFTGRMGIKSTPALDQRLRVHFDTNSKYDNPRAPQIRLQPFDFDRLVEVGSKARDLYDADFPARVQERVDDEFMRSFATKVTAGLAGHTGIAPRIFLRDLIEVIDKVDQFEDFDPYTDYHIKVTKGLTTEEAAILGHERGVDDIELSLES